MYMTESTLFEQSTEYVMTCYPLRAFIWYEFYFSVIKKTQEELREQNASRLGRYTNRKQYPTVGTEDKIEKFLMRAGTSHSALKVPVYVHTQNKAHA